MLGVQNFHNDVTVLIIIVFIIACVQSEEFGGEKTLIEKTLVNKISIEKLILFHVY